MMLNSETEEQMQLKQTLWLYMNGQTVSLVIPQGRFMINSNAKCVSK